LITRAARSEKYAPTALSVPEYEIVVVAAVVVETVTSDPEYVREDAATPAPKPAKETSIERQAAAADSIDGKALIPRGGGDGMASALYCDVIREHEEARPGLPTMSDERV
jgi:hypothetical protein